MGWFRRPGAVLIFVFRYFVGKQLVIEHIFEYNRGMQPGDHEVAERAERSPLDEALDDLDFIRHRTRSAQWKPAHLINSQLRRRSRCGSASNASGTGSRWSING